jgi:transposase
VPAPRPSQLDAFKPFIMETLAKHPDISAVCLLSMIRARGYQGVSRSHVRRLVKKLRPFRPGEAFLKLSMLPAEQAQVDWAHFGPAGELYPGRKLCAFVMTLSYSRQIFVRFFLAMRMREFLSGFNEAFAFFGGVPRTVLLDNLKSGVSERVGHVIRFNDDFLALCRHYSCEPRAANVRRGNEKGRVERSIRYVRDNFFPTVAFTSLAELNEQARAWCLGHAAERPWREDRTQTVGAAFTREQERLLPLPGSEHPFRERLLVRVPKQPYVWFDGNEYSVPHTLVGAQLELIASEDEVCIMGLSGPEPAAVHARSYGRHTVVENPEHVAALRAAKPGARRHSGLERLAHVIPEAVEFIEQLGLRGENIGGAVSSLLGRVESHGARMVREALVEVLASGSCTLRAVHFSLSRREMQDLSVLEREPAPVPTRFAHLSVAHHDTASYDALLGVKPT